MYTLIIEYYNNRLLQNLVQITPQNNIDTNDVYLASADINFYMENTIRAQYAFINKQFYLLSFGTTMMRYDIAMITER